MVGTRQGLVTAFAKRGAVVGLAERDLRPPVAAHIGEGSKLPLAVFTDDNRLARHPKGQIATRLVQLFDPAHAQPFFLKDAFFLARMNLGRGVKMGRHMPRLGQRLLGPDGSLTNGLG